MTLYVLFFQHQEYADIFGVFDTKEGSEEYIQNLIAQERESRIKSYGHLEKQGYDIQKNAYMKRECFEIVETDLNVGIPL